MTRYRILIAAAAVAFALGSMPVWAQGRPGGGEGGGGGGGASARPGGGGGGGSNAPVNTGGGGGGSSSGSATSGSSGGSSGGGSRVGAPSSSSSSGASYRAPSHPNRSPEGAAQDRRAGSGSRTGRAVPRGSAGTGERTHGTSRQPSSDGSASAGSDKRSAAPADRAVPTYSRPRDGRTVTGSAVGRTGPPVRGGGRDGSYYYPYGYGRYFWPGYGFGLGYYYDPFWYDPYYYGGGYGGGYGGYSSHTYRDTGSLRLKIKPREAKVYVDGYFVGDVDSFDGIFQRLGLESGGHRIELRADGYEPLEFEVLITPGETVTYKGDLKPVQ